MPKCKRSLLTYYKTVWRIAVKDATAFWSDHKIVTSLPAPLIGFLAWSVFKGLNSWKDVMQAAIVSVLFFLAAIGLTFIFSLVKAPKLLDDERQAAIRAKDAQITEHACTIGRLTKPKRTASEQHYYEISKAAIQKHGDAARTILRLILLHAEMRTADWHEPQPNPPDLSMGDVDRILNKLRADHVLGMQIINPEFQSEQVWTIPSAMKSALDELLYAEGNSDSTQA